jgi:hypothetical protein
MRTWILLAAAGCGTSGEPMHGDVAVQYGAASPKLVVGAAVIDKNTPGNMLVELGSDNVDCGTYIDGIELGFPSGVYVYFSASATTPGTDAQGYVEVMKSSGNNVNINGAGGSVTISTIDTRVTGSLTFMTTDANVGMISVSGSFDVKRCF